MIALESIVYSLALAIIAIYAIKWHNGTLRDYR